MPIVGTPIITASAEGACGSPLISLRPAITKIYGKELVGKMRGIAIRQNQRAAIRVRLLDDNGDPVNLLSFGFPDSSIDDVYTTAAKFREATERDPTTVTADGLVYDASTGDIEVAVPCSITEAAGVYTVEVGALNDSGLILSNTFYLFVERGMFTTTDGAPSSQGPPTLNELRLGLRDTPEGNRITDQYEFDIADICEGLVRAVLYWNTAPPVIRRRFDTRNFPFRHQWRDGVAQHLFEMAATYYRRNHLPYQGAGVAVDDLNKFGQYDQAAMALRDRWETWVRRNKVQMNMNEGFASFGSPYGWC